MERRVDYQELEGHKLGKSLRNTVEEENIQSRETKRKERSF